MGRITDQTGIRDLYKRKTTRPPEAPKGHNEVLSLDAEGLKKPNQ